MCMDMYNVCIMHVSLYILVRCPDGAFGKHWRFIELSKKYFYPTFEAMLIYRIPLNVG